MDLQLTGNRVLVTGGTRGIGRAIVEAFADEGAAVEFCARDAGEIETTEKALAGRGGGVRGVQVDVRDGAALTAWVAAAAERLGGIDAVVANVSALAIPDTEENWYTSFEVDLMHTVRLATGGAAAPGGEQQRLDRRGVQRLRARGGLRRRPLRDHEDGDRRLHLGSGLPAGRRGVRANVVSPGNTYFEGGVWQQIEQGNPDLYATAVGLNPTGQMGTPEDSARAVVFLSSPVSSRTTGTHLVVDGGLTRGIQL